ncbi:MAG: sulfotransferase [Phycisphaerae bacterium]|nr:sulfotransferase [Phycisphaerae bacterium]
MSEQRDFSGQRLIFVGGVPRSGTTLLQNMLDCHPEILGGPEFLYVPDIIQLRDRIRSAIDNRYIHHFCCREDLDRLVCDFIRRLLLPLADRNGCRLLSEKTPPNVLVFPQLLELFPDARLIHVIRDPRAVIASMLQVGRRSRKVGWSLHPYAYSVAAGIEYTRRCFDAGFAAAGAASQRVLTVSYERLVSDPEAETRRVCRFLELEWSDRMLSPGQFSHLGEEAITNEVFYDRESYERDPEIGQIDKWKSQLTAVEQLRIASAFAGYEHLADYGYRFAVVPAPIRHRALAAMVDRLMGTTSRPAAILQRLVRKLRCRW